MGPPSSGPPGARRRHTQTRSDTLGPEKTWSFRPEVWVQVPPPASRNPRPARVFEYQRALRASGGPEKSLNHVWASCPQRRSLGRSLQNVPRTTRRGRYFLCLPLISSTRRLLPQRSISPRPREIPRKDRTRYVGMGSGSRACASRLSCEDRATVSPQAHPHQCRWRSIPLRGSCDTALHRTSLVQQYRP